MNAKIDLGTRILLGLIFFVFGLNGFIGFFTPKMNPEGGAFMGALMATGYFIPVLKITEIVCGALILLDKFRALALVILSPVVIQILLFHVFLEPSTLPVALVVVALWGYQMYSQRDRFSALLTP